jgi:hypothetical protein
MSDRIPQGLSQKEIDTLTECSKEVANFQPEQLLDQAEGHLKRIRMLHSRNPQINVRLAEAIVRAFQDIFNDWEAIPPHARSWCRGMVWYFCLSDDDEHDFFSPIGFKDDAEIMNACLRLAGREDLCIDPEDFDDQ